MNKNPAQKMDILDFLRKRPFKGFVFALSHNDKYPKPITNRVLTLYGFARGYFSLKESFMLILPTRFKSDEVRAKYSDFVAVESASSAKRYIKGFIDADGSIDLYGHKFYPVKGNFAELIEFFSQIFISDQYKAKEYLKDGAVIIDAGANVGSFSVYSSNIKKNIIIHAFEPVRATFEILEKNTSPYKGISCHNIGLGDSTGKKDIFFSKYSTGGSAFEDRGIVESHRPFDLSEEAQITTIDDFVRQNAIPRVDFIKIDTEGYESKILNGAKETIKRFRPVIAMSAYHKADDKTVLPQIIRSISPDYEYRLVHAHEEDLIFYPKLH
jgi:FkbM family methyltransferase